MARLMRLHFASVGVPAARFSPLTLDFRSPNGVGRLGDDSVIWLRNGGGKSSILNLFFSLIIPSRRDFLGETADGRSQQFRSYVKPRDLSFIIAEWYTGLPAQQEIIGDESRQNTWVTGQMLHWQQGASTSDDANLKRWFFAFRTGRGMDLESLPIQGQSDEPFDNPKLFREWFLSKRTEYPAAECYHTENQTDWQRELRETLQLDPEMFRFQLEMNRTEGGADRVMRFKSSSEFAQFIFRVSSDDKPALQLIEKLRELRIRTAQRPDRLLEQKFLLAMQEPLTGVEREAEELDNRKADISAVLGEHKLLADASCNLKEELAKKEKDASRKEIRAEQDARDKAQLAKRLAADAIWYHREALQRKLDECRHAREQAHIVLQEAGADVRAANAAREWLNLYRTKNAITALRMARDQAQMGREPQLRALRRAAAAYRASLEVEFNRLRKQRESVSANERENATQLKDAREQYRKLGEQHAEQIDIRGRVNASIEARNKAFDRLLKDKTLYSDEEADSAKIRLTEDHKLHTDKLHKLSDGIAEAEVKLAELQSRRDELRESVADLNAELKNKKNRYQDAIRNREELYRHPGSQELELGEKDITSRSFLEAVAEARGQAQGVVTRLEIEGHDDRRTVEYWDKRELLPPSRDAETVAEWLKTHQVHALYAGEYLSQQKLSTDELQRLLESDPARFSGLVVMDKTGFKRITELGAPPRLSQPVFVSLPSVDAREVDQDVLTISSETVGMASMEVARVAYLKVRERLANLEKKIKEATALFDKLMELEGNVRRFQEEWGGDKLDELANTINSLERNLEAETSAAKAVATGIAFLGEQLAAYREEHQKISTACTSTQALLDRVTVFINEHGNQFPLLKDQLRSCEERIEQIIKQREVCEASIDELQKQGEALRSDAKELGRKRDELEQELQGIPPEYLSEALQPELEQKLEESRPVYIEARQVYEKNPEIERLNGQLEELENKEKDQYKSFQAAEKGVAEARWRRFAEDPAPELAMAGLDAKLDAARESDVLSKQAFENAERALKEHQSNGQELAPPLDARPSDTSAKCFAAESVILGDKAHAEEQERHYWKQAESARQELNAFTADAGRLGSIVKRLEVSEAEEGQYSVSQFQLPDSITDIDSLVDDLSDRLKAARVMAKKSEDALRSAISSARRTAELKEFSGLRDSLRSWVRVEDFEIVSLVSRRNADIRARLEALREELASMDEDRDLALQEFEEFARDSKALLSRIEKVSLIPAGLGEWSGQNFLEVRLPSDGLGAEERRARLRPLLDELSQSDDLPTSDVLAVRCVESLLGSRKLDIQLIKPHALGSVQRYPIGELGSFSDGERLTASVLIYCTLARLRARNRGVLSDHKESGALILDNPIGKCSHQGLLELQQRVARQLGVQLVYTTGIEDLGAIGTFVRVIRLSNTSRNQHTGDLHVRVSDNHVQAAGISFLSEENLS